MFRVSHPPRMKIWTKTFAPVAACAVLDIRREGPKPMPTAAAEAPRMKIRREGSKGRFMIFLLPDLGVGAREEEGRDPYRRGWTHDAGVDAGRFVQGAGGERASIDRGVRGLGHRGRA